MGKGIGRLEVWKVGDFFNQPSKLPILQFVTDFEDQNS
jgi:hypothetical protein